MPDSSTSEPYSLIARAKDSAAPEVMAGARLGRMISRKMVNRLAPSEAAASSTSGSISSSTGCTVRTTNGSVTNRKASVTAVGVLAQLTPERARRPVEAEQHQAGDDGRQRERDVDDDLEDPLAGELVPDQDPGDRGAHDDVDHGDQHRLADGEPQRGGGLRAGQGRPVAAQPPPRPGPARRAAGSAPAG